MAAAEAERTLDLVRVPVDRAHPATAGQVPRVVAEAARALGWTASLHLIDHEQRLLVPAPVSGQRACDVAAVLDHQGGVLQDDATLLVAQWGAGEEHTLLSTGSAGPADLPTPPAAAGTSPTADAAGSPSPPRPATSVCQDDPPKGAIRVRGGEPGSVVTHQRLKLDDHQVDLLRRLQGTSAAAVADHLGCSLLALAERLVAIRAVLGVDSTAAALDLARADDLI